jgi:hypothetical protein
MSDTGATSPTEAVQWAISLGQEFMALLGDGAASTDDAASRTVPTLGSHQGPALKDKKPPAPPPQPMEMPVLQGNLRKVPSDPDDPFSSEIEVLDIDGMPPLKEPMPKVRPHNDLIIKYLQDIPEFASGRAVSYCQSVADACSGFEKYAKKRIKDLTKPSFGAEQLFGALVAVVATVATGGLGGEALEGLAKLVAEGVKDAIKDATKDLGKEGFKKISGEGKAEELERMAESLAAEAKKGADAIKEDTVNNVSAAMNPLIQKLTGGHALNKQEDEFILPFAAADGGGKDRLYRSMGIPDLGSAKSVRLNLFGKLTWAFEDQIWEDKAKDDIEAQKDWLKDADSEEDKAKARKNIEELEAQKKHNARATAHNAWGQYKQDTTRPAR